MRVHYKSMFETAAAIRRMSLKKAKSYLEDVLEKKNAIPIRRYTGGYGRHGQAKLTSAPGDKVAWPKKAVTQLLGLLQNAEANAEVCRFICFIC